MQRIKYKQFFAFFLLLLFTFMQAGAALHVHLNDQGHQGLASSKTSSKHFLIKGTSKCRLCEYNHHRMPDLATATQLISLKCVLTAFRSLKVNYIQRFFETAVHTWTNKGPPAILPA